MSIEAMKQALEALESCGEDEWYTEDDFGMSQTYDEKKVENAITSLRQAIAEEEKQEPVACHTCKGLGRIYMGCGSWIHCDTCNTTGKATTPPKREPEPEPVAEVRCDDGGNLTAKFHVRDLPLFSPLYTFPPRREPLTDDEIADLWRAQIFHIVDLKLAKDFVRDIEAAHGIKGEEHGTR